MQNIQAFLNLSSPGKMEIELGKLFIGGISWGTNEERLREYFQTFGEVVEAVIMKDRVTGRARGFGFVVFADRAVAERVAMEKHMIDGRAVEAKKAVPRDDQNIVNKNNSGIYPSNSSARTKKIFVGGLPSMITKSDFKRYFEQFGTITDVVVMYDPNTQRPRGFGFVTYDSEEAVDKVLQKTFHELNSKMVEVKRAVPKELSPLPSRSHLVGYNHGLNRFSSFLNGYMQGYTPSSVGGYGVGMDGRNSPVTIGRNGFSPYSPSYGMGLKVESNLSSSYGGTPNLGSSLSYGRGPNTSYSVISNRYDGSFGYAGGTRANSIIGSAARNLWGNGNVEDATNTGILTASGSDNSGIDSFGSIGSLWSSSHGSGQGAGAGFTYNNSSLSYGSGNFGFGTGGVGYGRNTGSTIAPVTSLSASMSGYDGANKDIYETSSFYEDSTWRSTPSDLANSGSFGLSLGTQDIATKNGAGYIGDYTIMNILSN